MRCLEKPVAISHSCDRWPITALSRTAAPITSTAKPIQSCHDQRARHRSTWGERHSRNRIASTNTAGTTLSSPRTAGAIAEATTAPAIHHRVRRISAPAIRKKHSAAYGYATFSSTIIDENASVGRRTDAEAANNAARLPTTKRARPYTGNSVEVIATTSMYFTVEYAWRTL